MLVRQEDMLTGRCGLPAGYLHRKVVASTGAAFVDGVARLDQEGNLHPGHHSGQHTRAKCHAVAGGRVGKVAVGELVDGPALAVD